jgi:hypothetical protein
LDDRIPEEFVSFSSRLLKEIDQDSFGILVDAFDERLENLSDKRPDVLGERHKNPSCENPPSSEYVGIFVFTNRLLKLASEQHPFWQEAFNERKIAVVISFSSRNVEKTPALSLVIVDRSPARASKRLAFFVIDARRDSISVSSGMIIEVCRAALSGLAKPPKKEGFCCFVDFDYARRHEGTLAPWYYVRDSHIFAYDRAAAYANELEILFGDFSVSVFDLGEHERVLASALEGSADQAPSWRRRE